MPDKIPVVESRVTPDGRAPVFEKVGAGLPVAVTVKVPRLPLWKVARSTDVMVAASSTVNVYVHVPVSPNVSEVVPLTA